MPKISVDIEIYCADCGRGICDLATPTYTKGRGQPAFQITPCPKCLDAAREKGWEEGLKEGREEAEGL